LGEKVIDGYRSVMIKVSIMEKLKKIQDEKGCSSYSNAISYLLSYYEESTKTKIE